MSRLDPRSIPKGFGTIPWWIWNGRMDVAEMRRRHLPQARPTRNPPRRLPSPGDRRQQNGNQHGDNRDHYQQLKQRKRFLIADC